MTSSLYVIWQCISLYVSCYGFCGIANSVGPECHLHINWALLTFNNQKRKRKHVTIAEILFTFWCNLYQLQVVSNEMRKFVQIPIHECNYHTKMTHGQTSLHSQP